MIGDWVWISAGLVEAIHDRQLAEHGGPPGLRDRGLLESAVAPPRQWAIYAETAPDAPALAAAYAFGIARNHPFVDGNKRTAYVVCRTFLVLNGWDITGELAERYPPFLAVAEGRLSEEDLATWLRLRVGVLKPPSSHPSHD